MFCHNIFSLKFCFSSYEDEEHLEEKDVIRSSPPTSAREKSLFSFKGIFYQRLFRSQLRPKEVAKQDIGGDTMHDVLFSIWQKVVKYVRREVVFRDDVPYVDEKEQPDIDDIERFVTLQ